MPRNMLHERMPELYHAGSMKSRVSAICMNEAGDGWVVRRIGVQEGRMEIALAPSSNPATLLYVVRPNQ